MSTTTRPADAPLSRALVEEFGSWHAACQAALTHRRSEQAGVPAGGRRPWANPTRGRRRPPTYSRAEVLDAVRRTARARSRAGRRLLLRLLLIRQQGSADSAASVAETLRAFRLSAPSNATSQEAGPMSAWR